MEYRDKKYDKYFKALKDCLKDGGNYTDLRKLQPTDFGLPNREGDRITNGIQRQCILWTISSEYLLFETAYSFNLPELREIAKELGSPYSIVLSAYNLTRI